MVILQIQPLNINRFQKWPGIFLPKKTSHVTTGKLYQQVQMSSVQQALILFLNSRFPQLTLQKEFLYSVSALMTCILLCLNNFTAKVHQSMTISRRDRCAIIQKCLQHAFLTSVLAVQPRRTSAVRSAVLSSPCCCVVSGHHPNPSLAF